MRKGEPRPCGVGTFMCGGACAACGAQATAIWMDEVPPVSACDEHKEGVRTGSIDIPYARYTVVLRALLTGMSEDEVREFIQRTATAIPHDVLFGREPRGFG